LKLSGSLTPLTFGILIPALTFKTIGSNGIADKFLAASNDLISLSVTAVLVVDGNCTGGGKIERSSFGGYMGGIVF